MKKQGQKGLWQKSWSYKQIRDCFIRYKFLIVTLLLSQTNHSQTTPIKNNLQINPLTNNGAVKAKTYSTQAHCEQWAREAF